MIYRIALRLARFGIACLGKTLCAALLLLLTPPIASAAGQTSAVRTPVIVDTDIGDDSDDYWALAYALKSPDLDVRLITTTYGKQEYRGALIAKFLQAAGRTDIPIGLGVGPAGPGNNQAWLGSFLLADYKGKVERDGVQAMIDTINHSPVPVTIIAIGPLSTIGAALQRDPGIAAKARLCLMAGSIRVGYGNKAGQVSEYNIHSDIADAKVVFAAPWRSIAMAPLDTGDSATLVGQRYLDLLGHGDALLTTLLDCSATAHHADYRKINFSGSGFDTVAVFLAGQGDPSRFAHMEDLRIVIDDQGMTNIDSSGNEVKVATSWKDLDGYLDHFQRVLLKPAAPASNAP